MKNMILEKMKSPFLFLLLLIFHCWSLKPLIAQNPIIKDVGMSDPHVRVFNDTIYLYCGHDYERFSTTWVMKDWRIFSSTDLVNWDFRGKISPEDNYMDDNSEDCWAGDAAQRNDNYYFYFSDRKRGIGVMTSDEPTGPFKDALGKPLVAPMHDPTILIDDDKSKTPYIVYGDKEGGGFHVAELNNDMISLAEEPKPITIIGEEWENAPKWMDKNYIFKYKDTYYLSWGRDYATSSNIYGPYTCNGAVGHGHHLSEYAHGSFFWWKGQFYHIWCYYINPKYKFRESIISYCHIDESGKLVTDTRFLDKHFSYGVGRYHASWPKIEAEWYSSASPGIEKISAGKDNFVLSNIRNGDSIAFANVTFENKPAEFIASVKKVKGNGKIVIREDSRSGKLLGQIAFNSDLDAGKNQIMSCKLEGIAGPKTIVLIFHGTPGTVIQLDYIQFR